LMIRATLYVTIMRLAAVGYSEYSLGRRRHGRMIRTAVNEPLLLRGSMAKGEPVGCQRRWSRMSPSTLKARKAAYRDRQVASRTQKASRRSFREHTTLGTDLAPAAERASVRPGSKSPSRTILNALPHRRASPSTQTRSSTYQMSTKHCRRVSVRSKRSVPNDYESD